MIKKYLEGKLDWTPKLNLLNRHQCFGSNQSIKPWLNAEHAPCERDDDDDGTDDVAGNGEGTTLDREIQILQRELSGADVEVERLATYRVAESL